MKKSLCLFVWLLLSCLFTSRLAAQTMATNPLIYADVPDPDILRVGNNYYMSSTTMHFNPGVPIMKSTDLVNWSLVNYAYSTMANTDAFNLNNSEAYSGGSWASSISYNKGTYYVTTFSYTTGKTYIYKTADIEKGPWTAITLNKVYHDHSLFFDDDGKVYMAYGHDDIQLTEMKPDLTGEQSGGVNKIIVPKASSVAGTSFILTAEGTHLQKINGTYYVSNICWPNGKGRTQTIWKCNTLTGTYTGKVAFQSNSGAAQGEYVDTPTGKWYALLFQDNGSVGRIPDLMPVTWSSDGWPTVGVNGQVPATLDIPKGSGSMRGIVDSDEFTTAPPLKLQWQWNHNPNNSYWSLTQKSGYLRFTNERTDANVLHTTNTLTQRAYGPKCSGYVAVDVSGMKDGDYAGLVAFQNKYGFAGVKMSGTTKTIVMSTATGFNGTTTEAGNIALNQNMVYFRIDFDFTNRTDKAYFYYSLNGTSWTAIGTTLQMTYDLEHFVGYRFGLFSYATKSSGGYADFDYFRVGANITEAQNSASNPPVVSISAPLNNTTFTAPASVTITANASDPGGSVSKVEFFNGSSKLGEVISSPYSYPWTNVAAGTYSLTAVATDNSGNKTSSPAVTIIVQGVQAPFGNSAHPIPGRIEAEEYDLGGEGVAFHEANENGNEGGSDFRKDQVDIETTADVTGTYNVGYILKGEWLEYTVNVAATGDYNLSFRVASDGNGKTLHVEVDNADITGPVNVPNTTGWQKWETVTVENLRLSQGKHVVRIAFDSDYMNLNYIEFSPSVITEIQTETGADNFAAYPNPFTGGITIMCKGNFSYKVTGVSGAIKEAGNGTDDCLIGTNLSEGLYHLSIENDNGSFSRKIVKH